jgi:phosphatidylglycerophosphate synthase
MYASSKNKVIAADIFGKLKTIFQMFGIIVVFVFICAALSCDALFNSDHLLI